MTDSTDAIKCQITTKKSDCLEYHSKLNNEKNNGTTCDAEVQSTKSEFFNDTQRNNIFNFPPQCFLMLVVELCERFCFYGVRSVLAVYLTNELNCTQSESTEIYHYYITFCYLTPLLGGLIADQYLGKYKTICYLSLVYILGNSVISYGSFITDDTTKAYKVTLIGLLMVAFGTGGIKPCVSSICGDQFRADDEEVRSKFFNAFYFVINLGSMVSSFLTPKLRAMSGGKVDHSTEDILGSDVMTNITVDTSSSDNEFLRSMCERLTSGPDSRCYSLSFGLPSALMVVALGLFILGSKLYIKKPPAGSVIKEISVNAGVRLYSKVVPTLQAKSKWNSKPVQAKNDTKRIVSMLAWILPIAGFWSIFDLAGTRLTFICKQIDSTIYNPITRWLFLCADTNWIKEDQVEAINPFILLCLVPLYSTLVFPLIEKICRFKFTRLRQMTTGMFGLIICCFYIYQLQKEIDQKFTYVFPEHNDNSSTRNASLVYQMNYHSSQKSLFTDKEFQLKMHTRELDWNFINYDDIKNNTPVMPSNVFENSGVPSKRVWAKKDQQYFSNALVNFHDEYNKQENIDALKRDGTSPFIDFTLYNENLKTKNNLSMKFIDHLPENEELKSELNKVYLEKAKYNKFILFNDGELHRVLQDESRPKNGQVRIDVMSRTRNFMFDVYKSKDSIYTAVNGGFLMVCKNDFLEEDFSLFSGDSDHYNDPFSVNTKEYKNQPIELFQNWKIPSFKKYESKGLTTWSYIVPQKSDCYLTKKIEKTASGLCAVPNNDEIIDCDLRPLSIGVNAIYSVIDYGKSGDEFVDRFESDLKEQIKFNEDFYGLQLPLYHLVIFYTIMTTVEILVSISGLAYSYEEAPESLKAFVSSLWLLPVAIGNVLVVFLNHLEAFQTSVLLYFQFNLIFVIALFLLYVYVVLNYETSAEYTERKAEETNRLEAKQKKLIGQDNLAMASV